jgi:hypothetical protein
MRKDSRSTEDTNGAISRPGGNMAPGHRGGYEPPKGRLAAAGILSVCFGIGGVFFYHADQTSIGGNAIGAGSIASIVQTPAKKEAKGPEVTPTATLDEVPQIDIDFNVEFNSPKNGVDLFAPQEANVEVSLVSFEELELEVLAFRQVDSLAANLSNSGIGGTTVFGHNRTNAYPLRTQIGLALKSAVGLHPFGSFSSICLARLVVGIS